MPQNRGSHRQPNVGSRRRSARRPRNRAVGSGFAPFTPAELQARKDGLGRIDYPVQLPVSARREEIAAAIMNAQVVIVSGETGSGKTTQIPKICLELGRGITGMIGHTQPRRLAARTVAERIAFELGQPLGKTIGYQVRFTDLVSRQTLVKLMTDGILLAEIQSDPELRRYDTIIVDEAHERSLNIDFILGYLARLLPRRPDLKVIITSATIDSARFAEHFAQAGRPAPIIEVSGRTYPVEIRYRPLVTDTAEDAAPASGFPHAPHEQRDPQHSGHPNAAPPQGKRRSTRRPTAAPSRRDDTRDQVTGIIDACEELMACGPGDILVFLAGERDIRDTWAALQDHLGPRATSATHPTHPDAVEVVPLFARLSAAEQHRVFEPHTVRRIVLATNVAETSLTVPGIRYVVDPGLARISRFSNRTKVQRLPIEAISQASANQRSGRCGRLADGVAIRLYSEEDFHSRPRFTEPEILRTSLAAVILQMAALRLGAVSDFPFLDPPDRRAVRDGIALLTEIGALTPNQSNTQLPVLTAIGKQLAALPIDPRLGRMLLEANRNSCASEVLVIVAALSMQDVRERPTDFQGAADEAHRRFTDPASDFLSYLNLWRYLRAQQRDLSSSAFRRMCRREFLHYLRVREWQDLVSQLRSMAKPLGIELHPLARPSANQIAAEAHSGGLVNATARAAVALGNSGQSPAGDAIHRSLLVGLLSNLGSWDLKRKEYEGARGTHFHIWPGSGLAKKSYAWVMTAELVETSRLFARTVARIQPEWVEPLAKHLTKYTYSEPFWSTRSGAAMIKEKVLLYGLTLVGERPVLLGRLGERSFGEVTAAELAREMFIANGLVAGKWRGHHPFWHRNQELLAEAKEVERRTRTPGLVASEDELAQFFADRIPEWVISERHFDQWWRRERRDNPDLLTYPANLLLPPAADGAGFPDYWLQGDLRLPLSYEYRPGQTGDGVTVMIPVEILRRVNPAGFDWLVPGMHRELLMATIRALPKPVRRQLVPAPDIAVQILNYLQKQGLTCGGGVPIPALISTATDSASDTQVSTADGAAPSTATAPAPETRAAATVSAARNTPNAPATAQDEGASPALAASLARLAGWAAQNGALAAGSQNQPQATPSPKTPAASAPLTPPAPTAGTTPATLATPAATQKNVTPTTHHPPTSFAAAFTAAVWRLFGVEIAAADWEEADQRLPAHLQVTFRVVDRGGRELRSGKDLVYLQKQLAKQTDSAVRSAVKGAVAAALEDAQRRQQSSQPACSGSGLAAVNPADEFRAFQSGGTSERPRFTALGNRATPGSSGKRPTRNQQPKQQLAVPLREQTDLHSWPDLAEVGSLLPRTIESYGPHGMLVRGYPALITAGGVFPGDPATTVDLRIMADAVTAVAAHRRGVALLALAQVRLPAPRITSRWTGKEALFLATSRYRSTAALVEDAQRAAAYSLLEEWEETHPAALGIRREADFTEFCGALRQQLEDRIYLLLGQAAQALGAEAELERIIRDHSTLTLLAPVHQVRTQAAALLPAGFLSATPVTALPHLARYLRAAGIRIEKAAQDIHRDEALAWQVEQVENAWQDAASRSKDLPPDAARQAALDRARWLIAEFRVSVFAQQLGTPVKVSAKRILALLPE